eukprot:PITA_28403
MKLISWNIIGLNSPRKGRLLKNMIMQEKPQVLFLQETKCNSNVLDKIVSKVWPGGLCVALDSDGASGGLAILWDNRTIQLNNVHANKNFIQAKFHILGTNLHGLLTNVYFTQEVVYKEEILNSLSAINSDRRHPLWISGDDFNMIIRLEEKRGGKNRGSQEGTPLKEFIQNNWLIDMPFNNAIHIEGDFAASILPYSGSDHWPISLQWTSPGNKAQRPFRFEAFWLSHPDFNNLIHLEWNNFSPPNGSKMFQFQQKLKHLKGKIKQWNLTSFSNIFQAKQSLDQDMKSLQQIIITEGLSEEMVEQEKDLEVQILERAKQEETMWRQKSRIRWLKDGEKNTKFFHNTTIQRKMNNTITHIQNE